MGPAHDINYRGHTIIVRYPQDNHSTQGFTAAPSSYVSSDISASSSLDMRFMQMSATVAATPGKTNVQGKPSESTARE